MTISRTGQPGAVASFDNVRATDSTYAVGQTATDSVKNSRGRRNLKHKVALLGTGYIAEWHAKAIASIRDVELVAVCDQSQLRAEAFGRKFKVPRVYGTLGAMLAAEQLDAIHVLLPPEHHFRQLRRSSMPALTYFSKSRCV